MALKDATPLSTKRGSYSPTNKQRHDKKIPFTKQKRIRKVFESKHKTKHGNKYLTAELEHIDKRKVKVYYEDYKQQHTLYDSLKNLSVQSRALILQFFYSKMRRINRPTSTEDKIKQGLMNSTLPIQEVMRLLRLYEEFLQEELSDRKTDLMKHNQSTEQLQVSEFGFPQNNTAPHIALTHQVQPTMFEFKPYSVVEYLLRLGLEFEDNFKPISPQNITKTIAINLFLGLSEFFDADLELYRQSLVRQIQVQNR